MADVGLIKEVTSDLGTEGGEGASQEDIEKGAFQAEGAAGAKALRQELACSV